MKRRQFLKSSLVASLAIPGFGVARAATGQTDYDVVIIGAGISGLAAAYELSKKGAEVLVIEARNRIGGRIHTDFSLGAPFEWGAGWIHGPDGNPISALAADANVETYVTDDESLEVFDADGVAFDEDEIEELDDAFGGLFEAMEEEIDRDMPLAKAIAAVAPEALSDELVTWGLTAFTEFDTGGAIERLSAAWFAGDSAFGGEDVIPLSGYSKVLEPLKGAYDLVLDAEVTEIAYERGDGAAIVAGGVEYEASAVICTVPLGVLKSGRIAFDPPLPEGLRGAIERVPMGTVTKLALKFPRAFWPEDTQYFGIATEEKGRWPYVVNYRTFSDQNVLLPLSFGNYAFVADAMSDEEMVGDAMEVLRDVFGAGSPEPETALATHWSTDPLSLGAYSFSGFGSTPKDFEALGGSVEDVIFFAGEHTRFDYHATTHGALLSGRSAAEKVWKALP